MSFKNKRQSQIVGISQYAYFSDMNEIILAPCDVISKIKQNSSDMNEILLAPCDVISKIKQNSCDMNKIILAPCDAGYVQSCTGF
jgi:hypothetical protein